MKNISRSSKAEVLYSKRVTLHEFNIEDELVKVRHHQESNRSYVYYWNNDSSYWSVDAPQIIDDLGRDEEGTHLFEHWLPISEEMDFDEWKKEHVIYV